MKLTLSPRDKKLLLFFGALFVFLLLYFLAYLPLTDKAEATEAEIAELKPRLEQLKSYEQNLAHYKTSIEEDSEALHRLTGHYPNDVRPEDKIMYAVALEDNIGVDISAASFADSLPLTEFSGVRTTEDSYEGVALTGWQSGFSLSCALNYLQLKNAISFIYDTQYSTALDALSISYDSSTGGLTGTMNLSKYFITGLDDSYYETDAGDIPIGQPNPFRTIDGPGALPVQN